MSLAGRRNGFIVTLCLSIACSTQAFAHDHKPIYISVQVPNSTGTYPTCMNNRLNVAGYFTGGSGLYHGFVRDISGKFETFDVGSVLTQPVSINDRGEVAGTYEAFLGDERAFVRSRKGVIATFNPGGDNGYSKVTGINEDGMVAGFFATSNSSPTFGFLRYPDGGIVTFNATKNASATIPWGLNNRGTTTGIYGIFGVGSGGYVRSLDGHATTFNYGLGISPLSINDRGEITGWYLSSANFLGFVRSASGKITSFDFPDQGGIDTQSIHIDAVGDVTGAYEVDDVSAIHGFIRFCDGRLVTFDAPGAKFTYSTAISNSGVVTGRYYTTSSNPTGFLRIP
jgi:hypothetical protein